MTWQGAVGSLRRDLSGKIRTKNGDDVKCFRGKRKIVQPGIPHKSIDGSVSVTTDWLIFSHVLNAQLSNELEPGWGLGHIWQCPTEPVTTCRGTQVSPSPSLYL